MPSTNVELVRRANEAFRRGEMEAMLQETDPEVEFSDPERSGAGPFHGHQAFIAWLQEWLESWESYTIDVEALVEVSDRVVALLHQRGRARGSGVVIDHHGAHLYGLRDGTITSYQPFSHPAEALEAAGLPDGASWHSAIETILAGYAAWNRRDVDSLMKLLDPGVEFIPLPQSIMPAFEGREGMESFLASSADAWAEFLFVPLAFTPMGDRLMVELDVRGTARGSGIELEEHWAHVYTIRDGRIVRFHAFRGRDEALEALAYPEQS